jgi:hypothetical protein
MPNINQWIPWNSDKLTARSAWIHSLPAACYGQVVVHWFLLFWAMVALSTLSLCCKVFKIIIIIIIIIIILCHYVDWIRSFPTDAVQFMQIPRMGGRTKIFASSYPAKSWLVMAPVPLLCRRVVWETRATCTVEVSHVTRVNDVNKWLYFRFCKLDLIALTISI